MLLENWTTTTNQFSRWMQRRRMKTRQWRLCWLNKMNRRSIPLLGRSVRIQPNHSLKRPRRQKKIRIHQYLCWLIKARTRPQKAKHEYPVVKTDTSRISQRPAKRRLSHRTTRLKGKSIVKPTETYFCSTRGLRLTLTRRESGSATRRKRRIYGKLSPRRRPIGQRKVKNWIVLSR